MYQGKYEKKNLAAAASGHTGTTPPTPRRRRRKRKPRRSPLPLILGLLLAFLLGLMLWKLLSNQEPVPNQTTPSTTESSTGTTAATTTTPTNVPATEATTVPTTATTEPYIVSSASIGVTGDILPHVPVLRGAKVSGGYDFTEMFAYIQDVYSGYDYMVANLETTLGGKAAGEYNGYPRFNSPDSIVDALKGAGVDMLLTANNHTYDTSYDGMMRTIQVLKEKGMEYLGTRESEDTPFYTVKDINGIKVGMICYTYETKRLSDGRKSLNGLPLSQKSSPLVCSFDQDNYGAFVKDVKQAMKDMKAEGAEVTLVYMHWGNEYQLTPTKGQKYLAEELCNAGVDIIVGGHPHVIQPFTTLTNDKGHTTYCMYSTGNTLSNQRRERIDSAPDGHTEDGMVFEIYLQKWSDGTVEISEVDILPTWVYKDVPNGKEYYAVLPLDPEKENWDQFNIKNVNYLYGSYKRTMKTVGEGLNAYREAAGLELKPLSVEKPGNTSQATIPPAA